jgi:hypothetical protein
MGEIEVNMGAERFKKIISIAGVPEKKTEEIML